MANSEAEAARELAKYIWQNVISLSSEPPKNVVAEVEHALTRFAAKAVLQGKLEEAEWCLSEDGFPQHTSEENRAHLAALKEQAR